MTYCNRQVLFMVYLSQNSGKVFIITSMISYSSRKQVCIILIDYKGRQTNSKLENSLFFSKLDYLWNCLSVAQSGTRARERREASCFWDGLSDRHITNWILSPFYTLDEFKKDNLDLNIFSFKVIVITLKLETIFFIFPFYMYERITNIMEKIEH